MGNDLKGVLLPYQIEWLNDESEVAVWEKSRRIGASFVDALKSVLLAAKTKAEGGMNNYYMSYNKDMTEQYIRDAGFWAKKIGAAADEMEELVIRDEGKDILIYQIRFAGGHVIQALPSEARNIRSKQGRIIIDEAAFVDDLNEILKAALALLMWGGRVAVLSTHNGVDNQFNELIEDIKKKRFDYRLFRVTFDEALRQGLYKAICRAGGRRWTPEEQDQFAARIRKQYGDKAEEELDCVPSKSGGAYIGFNLIDSAMSGDQAGPVVRLAAPADNFVDWSDEAGRAWAAEQLEELIFPCLSNLNRKHRSAFGLDFGRSGDVTSIFFAAEDDGLSLYTILLLELADMPFHIQEFFLKSVAAQLPYFVGGSLDATGNGAALAEAARREWGPELIHEIKISESWYASEIPFLKRRFEDRGFFLPKDALVRDDLRKIKVINGLPKIDRKRDKTQDGRRRHGDSAVAAIMVNHAFRNAPELVSDWEPILPEPSETSQMLERFNR